MKKLLIIILLLFTFTAYGQSYVSGDREPTILFYSSSSPFIVTMVGNLGYSVIIDYGDEELDTVNFTGNLEILNHSYSGTGYYQIRFNGDVGQITSFEAVMLNISDFDVSKFDRIKSLKLGSNNLTVESVSNILINLDRIGLTSGLCYLNNQTPPAPPNSAGQTAKTNLINKGWTVITD
jgi:hypothetical protein